jgi:hypothetical protein
MNISVRAGEMALMLTFLQYKHEDMNSIPSNHRKARCGTCLQLHYWRGKDTKITQLDWPFCLVYLASSKPVEDLPSNKQTNKQTKIQSTNNMEDQHWKLTCTCMHTHTHMHAHMCTCTQKHIIQVRKVGKLQTYMVQCCSCGS